MKKYKEDICFTAGLGICTYGLHLIYEPIAFMFLGSVLMAIGFIMARKGVE